MSKIKTSALLISFLLITNIAFTQRVQQGMPGDPKFAKALFQGGDFVTALKEYLALIKSDSNNREYVYNIGVCYLNTNINKELAVPYLEKASGMDKTDAQVFYDLGRAYQYNYRFDEAIECFSKFKKAVGKNDNNYISADMQIEMCTRAAEMVKNPADVSFENLGPRINSPYPDYNPYVTRNEQMMVFSSKRAGNLGNLIDYDGYYTADIFMTENRYGKWDKSKRLSGMVNSPLVEETAGLSPDGSYMIAYIDNLDARLQIRYALKEGKSFMKLRPMNENVNLQNNGANAATVTFDRTILIFSRTDAEGKTGVDLYMSRVLPTGEWGPPSKLGNNINTAYDDDYPWLAPDGKTLYFASVGHNSMGGFDIFKTVWDQENNTWSDPVNLGYPVNTPDDNTVISFSASGRYAYMAALRKEGYGNLDIYRLTFNDVVPNYSTFIGTLKTDSVSVYEIFRKKYQPVYDSILNVTDSAYLAKHKISDTLAAIGKHQLDSVKMIMDKGPETVITATNIKSGSVSGIYRPNPYSGRFVAILGPGNYTLSIRCEGYKTVEIPVIIEDREKNVYEIKTDINLEPLK